jgi:DNA-binding transcriptional ArsR family regulator
MGAIKKNVYQAEELKLASLSKAIGHPARIQILSILLKRDTCVCGDIVDELPLSQSTVSQHLKALKSVGLIQGSIDGTNVCYCINKSTLNGMIKALKMLLKDPLKKIKCC